MGQDQLRPERRGLPVRFAQDRGGAIAPLAAVMIGAVLFGAGASLDISRLLTARTQLQDAVDSATLALARMPAGTSDTAMQAKAQAWITANVTDPNIQNIKVDTPVRSLGQVKLDVSASMKTTLAALMGVNTLPLGGHSTVKYGTTHVELALVLDNTGSMNEDSKLESLKTAATTLVNTLNASASVSGDANALKVGVVPFSMTVNVGSGYRTATWMSGAMPAAYGATADAVDPSHPNRFTLLRNMYGDDNHWGGCVESRPMPYDVQDTPPDPANPGTLFVPFFAPDEPDEGYYAYSGYKLYNYGSADAGNSNSWAKSTRIGGYPYTLYSENNYLNDGVNDAYKDKDTGGSWSYSDAVSGANSHHQNAVAKYKTAPASGTHPIWGGAIGPNAGCTVQPLQRLTTNISTVNTQINSMVAGGDTEIPLGLVWGWHVLSPYAPFADGADYGASGTVKVIVLVTDGANTYGNSSNINQSHYTAYGYADQARISTGGQAGTQTALNSRLQQLCANLKTRNSNGTWKVNIYAVPLEVSDTNIKSLLQGCVTDPSNYLDVSSSSQLTAAFANIAGSISALRVSH